MARIQDSLSEQLRQLIEDLLKEDPGVLTRLGISKQARNYLKNRNSRNKGDRLPPVDAVFAGMILLQREILIEGVARTARQEEQYSVTARPKGQDVVPLPWEKATPISILAGLDFPPDTVATLERAERKGPRRVELQIDLAVEPKTA